MKLFIGLSLITLSFFTMPKKDSPNLPKPKYYPQYINEWAKIDSLMEKGLIEDALVDVENLNKLALQQKNYPQIYKSLLHIEKLSSQKDELQIQGIIKRLEAKLNGLDPVSRSMIQSILGSLYLNANNFSRYSESRTEIKGTEQDSLDIQTWSPEKLIKKANELIQESLKDQSSKSELTADYIPVLASIQNIELCPSLYEVLLLRAIEHFSNPQTSLTDFNTDIKKEDQFLPLDQFVKLDIKTNPVLSLYQEWLKHINKSGQEKALVNANLKRLKYELQIFQSADANKNYQKKLELFYKENIKSVNSDLILSELIQYYINSNESISNRNNFQIADSLCDKGLQTAKDINCIQFMKSIKSFIRNKTLSIEQEKIIPAKEYSKIKINYSNLSSLHFKLYKVPFTGLKDIQLPNQEITKSILDQYHLIKSWKEDWKNVDDFKQHSVELKIEPLEFGRYYIMASNLEDNEKSEVRNGGFFLVSNLATFQTVEAGKASEIVVIDRIKGNPIPKTKVFCFTQRRERYDVPAKLKLIDTKTSDKDGKVSIPSKEYLQYYATNGKDIYTDESGIATTYDYREQDSYYFSFFLDRSIYRPGQTVYFKAIAINNSTKASYPKILTNKSFTVALRNANYQEVGSLKLKTNEFGTAHGSFVLPNSGLNGYFQLETSNGSMGFQVEEYKRPNFEIIFDTLKKSYSLNDEIEIKGNVKSYNGIPLETKIKYTVSRRNYFPWYDYWFKGNFPSNSTNQIDNGTTESNDKGEFVIKFKATESNEIQFRESIQQFDIHLDATDQNQETHSNSFTLNLSKKKLFIQSDLKPYVDGRNESFKIISNNIAGININSSIKLKVYSLESPNRFLKKRLWTNPDIQIYSQKEFSKYFPNDVYTNEDDIKNWKVGKLVFEKSVGMSKEFQFSLKEFNLNEGFYKFYIEAKDEQGNIDSLNSYTNAFGAKSKFNSVNPAINFPTLSIEPGGTAYFNPLAINADYYLYYRINSRTTNSSAWNKVDRMSSISYKINEEDRGGMSFSGISILNNRVFEFNHSVDIPWTNKALHIESISFRDKLLPGQNEEWTFKISDSKVSKEKYEVLASMYDQSLDQILRHQWDFNILPRFYSRFSIQQNTVTAYNWNNFYNATSSEQNIFFDLTLPSLNDYNVIFSSVALRGSRMESEPYTSDAVRVTGKVQSAPRMKSEAKGSAENSAANLEDKSKSAAQEKSSTNSEPLQIRKNLNETVFFYPQLYTDDSGKVNIKFTMNEAMTKWKLQLFAHSLDLKYGTGIKEVITRKPIQIKPYYPRFFRQGDQIQLSAMISNLSEERQKGSASLQILDANSLQDISSEFKLQDQNKSFELDQSKNTNIQWNIKISPDETRTFLLRYIAKGSSHSDGEEMLIPVVSNSKLITETLPLPVKGNQTKSFTFESLKKMSINGSKPHQFTLEFSSHPVWYAIQVLPYMMEFPHECSEQLMSRIYANAIGTEIMKKYPKVASTLKKMLSEGQSVSKLLQNQELKSALIEETPWVLDAQSESEQMKRVALLMDFNNMENSLRSAINKLQQRQNGDGSFSWFPGLYPDRYITQHIVIQISHLKRLKISEDYLKDLEQIAIKARGFLDYSVAKEYEELAKAVSEKRRSWEDNNLNSILIHYYYCKSLFSDWTSDTKMKPIDNYYLRQIENFWIKNSLYEQGLCSIIAHRNNNESLAQLILKSIKQRSLYSEELGRYWKNQWSFYWTQMPVETQALMVELFSEVAKDPKTVDELKTWLLKNKQTQHWGTTKATTEAIFAILAFGDNYTEENKFVEIEIENQKLDLSSTSTGISYFKKSWSTSEIKPEFANIKITNPNKSIAWGAAYYQYFQNLDKVDQSNMKELILNKELYLKSSNKKGSELKPITDLSKIKTGDIVTARIIIKADRSMDYVHLKVMRASGLEPIQQLSGYQYNGGLGYYMSPRDLATDFFISYLPKGTFVLEYDMRASFKGEFSDGISSLQCMYAPEFSAHSKGIRIVID